MSFNATVYRVLVASPGDLLEERGVIEEVIHHWNVAHAVSERIVLLPVRWESHAVPEYGDRPQAILNRRLVADCDLLIGAFWTRVGTPTGGFESGTVEEIEQFSRAGKPALLYFSSRQVALDQIDPDELKRVRELRARLERVALVARFSLPAELESKLARHLLEHVRRLAPGHRGTVSEGPREPGSVPAAAPAPAPHHEPAAPSGEASRPPGASAAHPAQAGSHDEHTYGMLYLDYWRAFAEAFQKSGLRLRPPTPSTRNYVRVSLRSGNMRLNVFASVRDRAVGVELVLKHPEGDEAYAKLKAARPQIEAAIGRLEWNELPASFRIVLNDSGFDPLDRGQWPAQHLWLIEMLKNFQEALLKRIGV